MVSRVSYFSMGTAIRSRGEGGRALLHEAHVRIEATDFEVVDIRGQHAHTIGHLDKAESETLPLRANHVAPHR
jgi:hypothetical protein